MNRHVIAIATLVLALATGCASQTSTRTQTADPGVVFVLVRHAEKAASDPKDPILSEAGVARAKRIAQSLADARVVAAYATKYRRTQLTAAPTSMSHHLDLRTYDASLPAAEFARQLRATHPDGTVLVVGHSNTIPELAGTLCACTIESMAEDEFDRWTEVRIAADGRVTLAQQRY
jgi:broad specificity phosphatase PhoE